MPDCLFCKIIAGTIPSKKVYEDELTYAFVDITPQAPVHLLVVPKMHMENTTQAAQMEGIFDACLKACVSAAQLAGIAQSGYRIITNSGPDARQSISHLHFHVLGGARLAEKMA